MEISKSDNMKRENIKTVVFDLWGTLIFGDTDSAISIFYKEITGEDISDNQIKNCMLINDAEPHLFLTKFLERVTPSNLSSMLLALKNPKSPMYEKILKKFNSYVTDTLREVRWTPGAIDLMECLREKYRVIIVSNVWAYQRDFFNKTMRLAEYADQCYFSCDLGMNKDKILKNLHDLANIDPANTVYVGKSYEFDILPAVNANLNALRITDENNVIVPEKLVRLIEEELDGNSSPSKDVRVAGSDKNDILIATPPFYKLLGSHNNRLNLSAAFLSSYLSSLGYESLIYHADSKKSENYVTRYQMLFNSIDFYESMHKEETYEEFEAYYAENGAATVILTCGDLLNPSFDSGNWDSTQKMAKIVRKINPRAYIVAMGPEIGRYAEDFDLIIDGEVESVVPYILERKARGRITGTLLPEEKLKEIPAFDIKNVITDVSPVSMDTIMWRRGCVGTCDFCRVSQINKGLIRYRTINSVFEDIRIRYDEFGLRNFYIVDANFTSHKEMVIDFCKKLSVEFPGIQWRTESRFDTLDEELLMLMKESGCTHLKLGLENALSERHQVKSKQVNLESASRWITKIHNCGIKSVIYLMLGGKWFTRQHYEQMYENAVALSADGYTVSLFNPYPGTPVGISHEEWLRRKFTGSHLDIRLVDFWKIPVEIVTAFFSLELHKGREDRDVRKFIQ